MKRDIYQKLLAWKSSRRRKPLILKGARQVGKTYIIKEFGKNEYDKLAYFDFEESPDLEYIFDGKLTPSMIIRDLSRLLGWQIEPKRHLIVLDEIQTSNSALKSLKYFQQDANEYQYGYITGVQVTHAYLLVSCGQMSGWCQCRGLLHRIDS